MTLRETVGRLLGRDRDADDDEDDPERGTPSHVCASCGEEYYTDPELTIRTCRNCGGVKVEPVQRVESA